MIPHGTVLLTPHHHHSPLDRTQHEAELLAKGETIDPATAFDSNCITPGTPFMDRLGRHLRFFVSARGTPGLPAAWLP